MDRGSFFCCGFQRPSGVCPCASRAARGVRWSCSGRGTEQRSLQLQHMEGRLPSLQVALGDAAELQAPEVTQPVIADRGCFGGWPPGLPPAELLPHICFPPAGSSPRAPRIPQEDAPRQLPLESGAWGWPSNSHSNGARPNQRVDKGSFRNQYT